MLHGASQRGHATEELLAEAGIAGDCLHDPAVRVPLAAYARLYNLVVARLDDEAFGLFATPMRLGCFEFLCRGMLGAPTLGAALARAQRFLRTQLPEIHLEVGSAGKTAQLIIEDARHVRLAPEFTHEWLLRLLHGLSCWLVGRGITLDAVDFPYPAPAHAADYALIYTSDSRFAAPRLAARFAANLLELPISRDEAALQLFLDGAPGKLAMLYRNDRELVVQVRNYLRAALPETPDLAACAAALGLSLRTLNRRLEDEGSSFRAIRSALRRDLALNRLAHGRQTLADIAAELGYADPSTFHRAVTGWTGMSPGAYRRRLQK